MLTKKAYLIIAGALRGVRKANDVLSKEEALNYVIGWISRDLKNDNPRFSVLKFKDYINKE